MLGTNSKYLKFLKLQATKRPQRIFSVNPTVIPQRPECKDIKISVCEYDGEQINSYEFTDITDFSLFKESDRTKWINIDGINKDIVESVCKQFNIHYLLSEDIQSVGLRPKIDEIDGHLFCLLQMLYFNKDHACVETEQVSLVLGKSYVISFQEDPVRDVFDPVRERLKVQTSKLRQSGADYLLYSLLDTIVDRYYPVMEDLGEKMEDLEEEVIHVPSTRSLVKINQLRKELIVLKRTIAPVRELVNGFIKSDSDLLQENTTKFFKDIYDHVIQANDLVENYRDMMTTMQDLYINQVNLKMNEVMKVMAIVTCLLAPAAVIGGIFGMNFENIPALHNKYGFYAAVASMLLIPVWMLKVFKKRGWF
ncbi:magnesium/cobalt transporter CorA [Chitinophagaceae bacterium LWZ2-11]